MRSRRLIIGMMMCCSLSLGAIARAQDSAGALIPAPDESVKGITPHELGTHMRFLASDFMRGRDTASPETKIASEYLAAHLAAAGAEPAGDTVNGKRTFFAKFPLEVTTPEPEATKIELLYDKDGTRKIEPLEYGTDFSVFPFFLRTAEIEAPVVYAGYGIIDASKMIDEYAGLDVKNKIVLVTEGVPEGSGLNPNSGSPFAKLNPAAARGALAVVLMSKPGQSAQGNQSGFTRGRGTGTRGGMSLPSTDVATPLVRFDDRGRDQLFLVAGIAPDALKNGPIEGLKMKLSTKSKKDRLEDRNVVALFEGSDSEKKKEVVIYSAHYDHVGVNERGEIFNGSDDNASGTSAILEIAEAYGTGPKPARSVAFLWVAGEEKGLLGSAWFSDHVTLPKEYKIVADINLDMVSRNADKQVGITPSPKHPEYNSLVVAGQAACKAEEVEPLFNADEFFGRTDSFNFARKGIPIIFFFSGLHGDYHRPTDDVEKADFEKAARIARVAYRLGWHIASAADVPKKVTAEPKEEKAAEANSR